MRKRHFHMRRCMAAWMGTGLLLWICMGIFESHLDKAVAKGQEDAAPHEVYDKDDRLELLAADDERHSPVNSHLGNQYQWGILYQYPEEEIAESTHAVFDRKNRLCYALGYSGSILSGKRSYCEERVYEWDDKARTCRQIYYKSTGVPYGDGYYVAHRYMFDVRNYQFSADGKVLSEISYSREVGSDQFGYSEELFFDRAYQAEYDGERLVEELWCVDYWGSNESGAWKYYVYQYDDAGNCILKVIAEEDDITLHCYEYDEKGSLSGEYGYLVKEDWELECADGSVIYFRPEWQKPAVKKVAADGTVERELYYFKVTDMGQQHYLMPEDVEDTVDDHKYTVRPGDCLRNIAYKNYGDASYYSLLYYLNRDVIGPDENLILTGTRLVVPEVGSAKDTRAN